MMRVKQKRFDVVNYVLTGFLMSYYILLNWGTDWNVYVELIFEYFAKDQ